jgi:HTH-type transcriptional regulator / antitoxin HigA
MSATRPRKLSFDPDYAVAPGATLRSTLDAIAMTQSGLAARCGLSTKHVNQIAHGIAPITHDTALAFEKVTGVPAVVWNRLEANYRDRLARLEDRQSLGADAAWLDSLPVKELVRRGALTKTSDTGEMLEEVCRFFGVANRASWERIWRQPLAAFRRSQAFQSDVGAVASWLRLGEREAAEIECKPFNPRTFRRALEKIRSLTRERPEGFVPEMVRLCAESGVALVFVPEITGTRASGAARWLSPTRAVIQLSLRHKADDHLFFSFYHEAAHLLLHSKKDTFVSGAGEENEQAEEEANDFSASFLIPKRYDSELRRLRSQDEIVAFADDLGIAPGIVVGRLQKEQILRWNQCNQLKQRYRFADEP